MKQIYMKYNFPNYDIYYAKLTLQYKLENLGDFYPKFPSPLRFSYPIPIRSKFYWSLFNGTSKHKFLRIGGNIS
jgi:hypothetical protein